MPARASLAAVLVLGLPADAAGEGPAAAHPWPDTRKGDVVDDHLGTKVADPYRWLEDDDAPETAAWVKAQQAASEAYLAALPSRASFMAPALGLDEPGAAAH
jgi:hypothetical protein